MLKYSRPVFDISVQSISFIMLATSCESTPDVAWLPTDPHEILLRPFHSHTLPLRSLPAVHMYAWYDAVIASQ